MRNRPEKDRIKSYQLENFVKTIHEISKTLSPQSTKEKRLALEEFRWMVEEFKISLFAQELKTLFPVSRKRLEERREEIERMV